MAEPKSNETDVNLVDAQKQSEPGELSNRQIILQFIERLSQTCNIEAALDVLYELDGYLTAERFDLVEELLNLPIAGVLSTDLIIVILRKTLPVQGKLPSRSDYYSRVEITLKKRGEAGLLTGLEG